MKLSTKYIGGLGEDLTGSSTLFKIGGKDPLSIVIDYGLHQGGDGSNELNNMTDNQVLKADYIIITHAHMDHIGRLPTLVAKGFKGKILMTKMTKELASIMLVDNVSLNQDQIKKVDDINKKKANILKVYLRLLNISKLLKDNKLKKVGRIKLEKERDKLLKGRSLEDVLNESISSLKEINTDIDLAKILPRKQAENLLDIQKSIESIYKKREDRLEKQKNDFLVILDDIIELKSKLNSGDNLELKKELEKKEYVLSLHQVEIKDFISGSFSIKDLKLVDINNYEKKLEICKENILNFGSEKIKTKSKFSEYSKEAKELDILMKKRKNIIGDKDLDLCLLYSKKISGKNNDFDLVKNNVPKLLYDTQTVYKTLEMIETLEVGKEINLDSRIVIKDLNSDVIDRIPAIIKNGYDKKVYVSPALKNAIIKRWYDKLDEIIEFNNIEINYNKYKKFISDYDKSRDKKKLKIPNLDKSKDILKQVNDYYSFVKNEIENNPIHKLRNKLEFILQKVEFYQSLKDLYSEISINNKNSNSVINIQKQIESLEKELLDENIYGIENKNDIENIIKEKYGKKDLPYNKRDIIIAKARLTPSFEHENQRTIESVSLEFLNAGHVEGSIMASITIVTKKVENILDGIKPRTNDRGFNSIQNIKKEYMNYIFTGDMGKFSNPNLSGIPDIPDKKIDYIQIESTYADRNHPDKLKHFKILISELNNRIGKVLIPVFSFQRMQELLVELLQNKLDNIDLIKKYSKLKQKLKKIKKDFGYLLNTNIEDLDEENKELRIKKFNELSSIEKELNNIKNTVFLGKLHIDAPLAVKISEVFLRNYPEKYKLLDLAYQKEVFGEEQVVILGQGEYKKLYTGNRTKSRDIILSSGGMIQGGAILNHIKEIVSDKHAKIIFTGYQAKDTLGGKISSGEKNVVIDGERFEVNARKVFIGGYSSHIQKDDIIDFLINKLSLSKKSVIALVHGTSNRKELCKTLLDINNKFNIIIPKIGDRINLDM